MSVTKILNVSIDKVNNIWGNKSMEDYSICKQAIAPTAVKYIGGSCTQTDTASTPATTRKGDLIIIVVSGRVLTTEPTGFTTIANNYGEGYNDYKISIGYKYATASGVQTYGWAGGARASISVFRGAYIKASNYLNYGCSVNCNAPSITVSAGSVAFAVCHYTYSPSGCTYTSYDWSLVGAATPPYTYSAAWYRSYPLGGTTSSPYLTSNEGVNYCTAATLELALQ